MFRTWRIVSLDTAGKRINSIRLHSFYPQKRSLINPTLVSTSSTQDGDEWRMLATARDYHYTVVSELFSAIHMQSMSYLRIFGRVMSMSSILVFVCALPHLLP